MKDTLLIVGLGNPGSNYEATRHNIGRAIIRDMAEKEGWKFKKDPHVKGEIAYGMKGGKEVHFLFPTTFMNNSGLAVEKALKMLQMEVSQLLVVFDDVYTPFGKFRFREKGSAGGHNGVKSVIEHLLTSDFHRLKVGVGAPDTPDLEDFVLGEFTKEESIHIPKIIQQAELVIDSWIIGEVGRAKEIAADSPLNS